MMTFLIITDPKGNQSVVITETKVINLERYFLEYLERKLQNDYPRKRLRKNEFIIKVNELNELDVRLVPDHHK